jgi:hypothetical protein
MAPILAGGLDQARTTALQEAAPSSCCIGAPGRTEITRLAPFSSWIATAFVKSRSSKLASKRRGQHRRRWCFCTGWNPFGASPSTPLNKRRNPRDSDLAAGRID